MGKLTIKYANPLGAYDQKYGQRYYGKAHDTDMDISFNLMNPVNFEDGQEIEFEEKIIKEKGEQAKNPGEEYLFLKKVKTNASGNAVASGSAGPKLVHSQPTQEEQTPASAAEPSYEAGTNARWALKLAVDTYKSVVGGMPDSKQDYDQITKFAKWLIQTFSELKSPAEPGLEKARATAAEIKSRQVEDVTGEPGYEDPFEGMDVNDAGAAG
jgi:hypothetical protein